MVKKESVVIKDSNGLPNFMTGYFWTGEKDPAAAPPMFVVCGEVMDAILISQYHNTMIQGNVASLPYREPCTQISLDRAVKACQEKGEGWHLLTNTEYAFLLEESRRLGTEPHGNTDYGKDYNHPEEKGVLFDGRKTLTGLDPVTWSHDHTEGGVFGLNGNVWEMVTGLRLRHGIIEYIPQNDAAMVDTGAKSDAWQQARTPDGKPVRLSAGDGITITTGQVKPAWEGIHMKDVQLDTDTLEEIPQIIYDLAILPPDYKDRKDGMWVDSELPEAVPFRGSGFDDTSDAGASAVYLATPVLASMCASGSGPLYM